MKTNHSTAFFFAICPALLACERPCPTFWMAREQTVSHREHLQVNQPQTQHSFTVDAKRPVYVVVAGQITWENDTPRGPLVRLRLTTDGHPASTEKVIDVPNANDQLEALELDRNIANDRPRAGFTDAASTPAHSRTFAIALPNLHCGWEGTCQKRTYTWALERIDGKAIVNNPIQVDWHVEAFTVIDYDACPVDDRRRYSLPDDPHITLRVDLKNSGKTSNSRSRGAAAGKKNVGWPWHIAPGSPNSSLYAHRQRSLAKTRASRLAIGKTIGCCRHDLLSAPSASGA